MTKAKTRYYKIIYQKDGKNLLSLKVLKKKLKEVEWYMMRLQEIGFLGGEQVQSKKFKKIIKP